ncbi:hypothetical protein MCOR27_004667 [Pyricularia oryzae]|uniref:Chromodomain helicase hrp3 n=2 Tax=Pyricularia TaxID=48558 RepID=A0ABQ8NLU5_PYRGI|nr:hypothetical protein MCOR01_011078 [Pyricularia oryzae]KAI6299074.1 hypothetical protein MCOR33_004941 [Pyricularia grisea]KAH9437858.1 hypothetical protein MCOR02_001504 [Pyricularia oryzae]KAI6261977.1 hypothetical protein MCOR19_001791 [Pyricularia oryzae]KAI6280081.1 hypothetical protein MCOR26_003886 [Pyricularia oryzae]
MSTSPEPCPTNGHHSDIVVDPDIPGMNGHRSDSDLSDAAEGEVEVQMPSPDSEPESPNPAQDADDVDDHEVSEPSDNDASEDGDFDAAESPASARIDAQQSERSSSADSRRHAKRKAAGALEEDFMRENPELYGLRRSNRPTQRRKIVDSDEDEVDGDSEDEVVPAARKGPKKRRVERSQPSSKRDTPLRTTSADASDSDNYGGARARSFQKKARRQQEAQAYQEKRWSSRRAAQVSAGAYNESEVDDAEDIDDTTPNYWAAEVEDNSPYIEKILKHRKKEDVELSPHSTRHDFEYYIKWQGKSHMHDTWETTESVHGCRGFRRLENYFRKVVEYELDMSFGEDVSPELKEQWALDREREQDAYDDYTKVERIVAVRDGDGQKEYLVKWKGLQYDECTWEPSDLISSEAGDKIDQFTTRSRRSWQSDRKESNPDTRSRMTKMETQPDYIQNGELREFQLKGLNFLALNWARANNVILADEMGLGKTVQTVSFLSWLRNSREQEGPFLVVAPLSVIPAWCDTFNNWSPDLNYIVYLGPEAARATIREHELLINNNPKKPKFNVLVTSYDYILLDAEFLRTIKWQVLAVDEAHRLKNRESQLYAKLLSFNIPCKLLITGTPIQNNLAELSALLDFLNPGKVLIDDDLELLGKEVENKEEDQAEEEEKRRETQAKLTQLHKAIAPFILRRTKETVESDLPPKTEKIIRVELSDVQLEYYKNILTRNYAALSDASGGHKASLLNIMMELKKVSNHPYMFQGVEERVLAGSTRREDSIKGLIKSSGKMMLLDQLLAKLKKDNHRVLIFSQMVKMLDILGDYLRVRGYQYQRLDGTIPAGPRRMAINHFNAPDSEDFCFLLSTRAGGLGINLMTADTVIIYDSDWNPQADLQAMARAHRIGQKRPVNVYRLVAKQTVEEEVVNRARNKLFLEYLTIQAGVTDEGKALREQFQQRGLKLDEAKTADDIQNILKLRSQNLFEQSGNQERLEQLDIDSILEHAEVTKTNVDDKMNLSSGGIDWDNWMHFTDVKVDDLALNWDEIIPAEQLASIKAEEEKKKHDEYLAKAQEENAPRKATLKANRRNGGGGDNDSERAERLAKKRQRERQEQEELAEQRALMSDPRRALNEKETRNLIRAVFRYGSLDDREEEVLQEARLTDRDPDYLREIVSDLVAKARAAVDENSRKLRDEEEKSGKIIAKKDKKAVLVDFGEVKKVNAETVIDRPPQLKLLRKIILEHGDNATFRLPDASKAAHYSCEWGPREDGMLLVGIDRYGFGAWTQIRDDPELNMEGKFFLEEHRVEKKEERKRGDDKSIQSPGAVHLVRRSEYLLSVLLAKHSDDAAAQKAVENHHRSKKNLLVNGNRRSDVGSASPAPASKRAGQGKDRNRDRAFSLGDHRGLSNGDRGTPRPDKRKHENDHDERGHKHRRVEERHGKDKEKRKKLDPEAIERLKKARERSVQRFDELMRLDDTKLDYGNSEHLMWSLLKPVRKNFEKIMHTTADRVENAKERARIMGNELQQIGNCFTDMKANNDSIPADQLEALMPRFWDFLSSIWPVHEVEVSGGQLATMYKTLKEKSKQPKTGEASSGLKLKSQKRHRMDLEDGEIDTARDSSSRYDAGRRDHRRDLDDYYRRGDDRRGDRDRDRDERDSRRRYYENGDRLSFGKVLDRRDSGDRARSSWHNSARSPHR